MVMVSLKKAEIILIESSLFGSLKASKSAFEQESTTLLLEKFARFTPMAKGERKTVIAKPKRRKKLAK